MLIPPSKKILMPSKKIQIGMFGIEGSNTSGCDPASIAYDAFSKSTIGTTNRSWTHTPSGVPKGIIVFVLTNTDADQVSSVTYGGVSMTEDVNSPSIHSATDDGAAHTYFLGSGIPAGAQTVLVTVSGSIQKQAYAVSITADGDLARNNSVAIDNVLGIDGATETLTLGAKTSFVVIGFWSSTGNPVNSDPLANWTQRDEFDFGTESGGCYTYDIIGSSDLTVGWQTDDIHQGAAVPIAISCQ